MELKTEGYLMQYCAPFMQVRVAWDQLSVPGLSICEDTYGNHLRNRLHVAVTIYSGIQILLEMNKGLLWEILCPVHIDHKLGKVPCR